MFPPVLPPTLDGQIESARDLFAAYALFHLMTYSGASEFTAMKAYDMADLMMVERAKRQAERLKPALERHEEAAKRVAEMMRAAADSAEKY